MSTILKNLSRIINRNDSINGQVTRSLFGIPVYKRKIENSRVRKYLLGIRYFDKIDSQILVSEITSKISSDLTHNLDKVLQEISNFKRSIPKPEYFLPFESCFLNAFYEAFSQSDFKQRFLALMDGLDDASRTTVSTILGRIKAVQRTSNQSLDFFTPDEQQQLIKLQKEFWGNVTEVSPDLFSCCQYLLPVNHFEAIVFYYKHGLDVLKNPEYFKDKDIIDAGAFIGESAIVLSSYTNRTVYSFEPVFKNYELAIKTLELNKVKNCKLERLALGTKPGQTEISDDSSCSNIDLNDKLGIKPRTDSKMELVDIETLDNYVERHSLKVGLIKVDLEGFEQQFLAGAMKTIREQKPTLLISIYHTWHDFFEIKPLIESWNLGYRFKIVKFVDVSILIETTLIAEVD
jgi:FkbM family methyltransferase